VIREGRPLAFHYEVSRNALSRRDRLPSRRSSRGIRPRMKLETLKDDIREVAEHTYEVAPSIVEELKEGSALMRSARMLPHSRDGKLVGIKLFGIRRSSVLGALGFKNGDTITAINGQPVTSPDRMLEIFGKLAPEPGKEATVEVTRRGRPITLRYRVRKRPSAARFVRPSALPPTVPSSLPPQLLQP